ncbi:MAG: hypothetical protein PHG16_07060 [Lachnospiraceae bacterium]|nr:hypothetical protein [Lachnospiraceae bacterium]
MPVSEELPAVDYSTNINELLAELKTLNQNLSDFVEYEKHRDELSDQAQAEKDAAVTPTPTPTPTPEVTKDPKQEILVDMQSMLKSVDANVSALSGNETVDYSETLTQISDSAATTELNSYLQIGCLLSIMICIGMILGSEFAKHFFRKW